MTSTKQFQALVNFRDVGQSINQSAGEDLLATNRLYRSARPDFATEKDVASLADVHHVKTILDLRTDTERLHMLKPENRDRVADLQRFNNLRVDLNGKPYQTALINGLSYWQSAQMITYYVLGYRKDAISILSEAVLAKRGLVGLAKDSLTYCTAEVKEVFDILAEEDQYPVLVHCTQDPVMIDKDYFISDAELDFDKDIRVKEINSVGLPAEFASCAPNWTQQVVEWIREEYGDVHAYLKYCGVSEQQQQDIISLLRPVKSDR